MRLRENGAVWLEKGEPIPVVCECDAVYQPPIDSEWSQCPGCGRDNVHELMPSWVAVRADE